MLSIHKWVDREVSNPVGIEYTQIIEQHSIHIILFGIHIGKLIQWTTYTKE